METHLQSAVIWGALPKKGNNEILIEKKNRETETERGVKRIDKNDSDELTEEANDTPIQMFSFFQSKTVVTTPRLGKGWIKILG